MKSGKRNNFQVVRERKGTNYIDPVSFGYPLCISLICLLKLLACKCLTLRQQVIVINRTNFTLQSLIKKTGKILYGFCWNRYNVVKKINRKNLHPFTPKTFIIARKIKHCQIMIHAYFFLYCKLCILNKDYLYQMKSRTISLANDAWICLYNNSIS